LFAVFPYQTGNVIVSFTRSSTPEESKHPLISRLLQWAPNPRDFVGSVPETYFSFEQMIGYWGFLDDSKSQGINSDSPLFKKLSVNITNLLFIFLVIGIAILFLRKEQRDIFLLAWLISLYLVLHRDLIGKFTFLHRSLSATAHIFIPIIAIGALSISSLIRMPKMYRFLLKYGIAALIVAFTLMYNMPPAFSKLDNAYNSPLIRLNPAQIEVSEWLKDNIPEDINVSIIGTPEQLDKKVWWMASYSHRVSHYFEGFFTWSSEDEETKQKIASGHLLSDYVVFDYSDIALLSDRSFVERWSAFEQQNMVNHTLLYNKDNMKVYKYESS